MGPPPTPQILVIRARAAVAATARPLPAAMAAMAGWLPAVAGEEPVRFRLAPVKAAMEEADALL